MQNDRLERLASAAETLPVPQKPQNNSEVTLAPAGFRPEDMQLLSEAFQKEMKASGKSREELEVEETAWSSEDSLAAAQRFFSSAALGWGDELGLWGAAIAASASVDTPVGEIYAQMRKDYDAKQEEFKQRQGAAATAADIAGAVVSPATYLATPAALVGRAGQAGSMLARAGAEGAVYGAGEAAEGQRLEGAGGGALGGFVGAGLVKGVTSGFGKATDVVSKRRVEGDLVDADGDFVPITLAASNPEGAEGLIHTFYRDIVSPSFGGKGVVKQQEEVIIGKAEDFLNAQKAFSAKLDEGIKNKEELIKQQMKDASTAIKNEADNLKTVKKQEAQGRIVPLQEKLQALKTGKAEEIVAKAASETQKILDSRRLNFRNETFLNSFPAAATGQDIERILRKENIGERARALDNLWQSKGYSMIKEKKFRFKSGELETQLQKALQEDDYFAVNTVDVPSVMKIFNKAIEDTNFFKDPSGRIDGALVSSLRSRVGTLANKAADPQQKRALYTVQDEIDKIMKSQLTGKQKEAFEKEAGKWKSTVVLRETIEKAQSDPKKRGFFNESDWIAEVGKNNRWDSRYGTGPLNRTARTLEFNLRQTEKTIAKRAANLGKVKARIIEGELKSHRNKLASSLSAIDNSLNTKKAALSRNPQLSSEIAQDISRKEKYTAEIAQLDQNLARLKELRSVKNPSWFYTLAATGILSGLALGGQTGALTAAALGTAAGRGLSTPTAQRAIAGQTNTQQRIQKFLQDDKTGRTADILARAGGVLGSRSGMFTE